MTFSRSDSHSTDALERFKLCVFLHFSSFAGLFLSWLVGFSVGFEEVIPGVTLTFVQAVSSLPGLFFCENESKVSLAGFVTCQMVVGASELSYAILLFVNAKIFYGIVLLLVFFVQCYLIFHAFWKPKCQLQVCFVRLVDKLFEESRVIEVPSRPVDTRTVSQVSFSSMKSGSNFCGAPRNMPLSSPYQAGPDKTESSFPNGEKAKEFSATQSDTEEAVEASRILSAKDRKSLEDLVKDSRIPVSISSDASNSIEQYLFEECIQATQGVKESPKNNVLPQDIGSSNLPTANQQGGYRLIHLAKKELVKETSPGKATARGEAKTKDTRKTEKKRYPGDDGVIIKDSPEDDEAPKRWQFAPQWAGKKK